MKKKPTKLTIHKIRYPTESAFTNAFRKLLFTSLPIPQEEKVRSGHSEKWILTPCSSITQFLKPLWPFPLKENFNRIKFYLMSDEDDSDNTTLMVGFDLRIRPKALQKGIGKLHQILRKELVIESRKERYSIEKINEVRKLLERGVTKKIQIFKKIYPQFSSFNPRDDYLLKPEGERTLNDYDAWSAYQKTSRLVDRANGKKKALHS